MACASCGTGTDGKPGGCRSNGTCSTGGCNKLNVYNWLSDMVLPNGQQSFDVVEVRFKGSRKEFFRNKELQDLRVGDMVAVEGSPGHDVGTVSMVGELVRFQLRKKSLAENSESIKALYRKAKPGDVEKWCEMKDKEPATRKRTREIIESLKLNMKLSDVEFQGDGKKATFYYTAEERVDFRELIKRLADEFRIRVEMRQIGMRQEASRLGGIGVCGRELCCSTWLTDFKTVSTSAARYQNLALNPAKLAGQCGKLKCCLNYELDSYMDAVRDIPASNIILETEKGRAFHRKTDIFKRLMWYAFSENERRGEGEQAFTGEGNWVVMPVDRVKEIVALNKEGKKPGELMEGDWLEVEVEEEPDYANVVGQDRIDRMDKKKKKKKKKKSSGSGNAQQAAPTGQAQGGQPQGGQPKERGQQGGQQRQRPDNRPQGGKGGGPRPQQNQQQGGKPQQQGQQQNQQQRQQQGQRPQQQGQNNNRQQQQGPRPQQQPTPRPQGEQRPQQEQRPQGGNREPRQRPSAPPRQSPGQSTPPPESN